MTNELSAVKNGFCESQNIAINTLKHNLPKNYNFSIIEKDFSFIYKKKKSIETFKSAYITQTYKNTINDFIENIIYNISNIEFAEDILPYILKIKKQLEREYFKLIQISSDMYL